MAQLLLLTGLIFAAALLYSSVGHAGASGYLAAMALCGVAPSVMRPSALLLNILVATITTIQYYRAGRFAWSLFWPFAIASAPLAFVGGMFPLSGTTYRSLVGAVLLGGAVRLALPASATPASAVIRRAPLALTLACGAALGLLSGLTGTGGGIFLSPLLLFAGWAEPQECAGVSAAFILANSVAGLAGVTARVPGLPAEVGLWAAAAGIGGLAGATLGSRRLGKAMLRRLLAVVLVIAGLKLLLT